jgi:ATP-dependent RNA helicase DDX19/DBP5
VQWILFSATYPVGTEAIYEEVQKKISEIVEKAQQVRIKPEKLKLNHIK